MTRKPGSPRRPFPDLQAFILGLESIGQLKRIPVEVDPVLEVTEIVERVVREGGPALLFERPKGSDFPLVINLFGSEERVRMALGRPPAEIGMELIQTFKRLNPPTLAGFWRARGLLWRAMSMRPKVVSRAIDQEVIETPDLSRLPVLQCWPEDGGRFITFGEVLTEHPVSRVRNLGLYRLQVHDPQTTGMHWQSMKGGRAHHFEAERSNLPLEAAVVLGGDPILMLSAMLPLPEDVDEIAFAGLLRGAPTPMVRGRSINLLVPANAEFILEGVVPPHERRTEGPFGDHFGHYSDAADFPVLRLRRITRRSNPIYPATVVGKPPQEDKFMGIAADEMIGPLIRLVNPNIVEMCPFVGAGFHNLLGVSLRERHPKEVIKTALGLLGVGQLSLTKVMILVREDINPRRFDLLLRELWLRFEPEHRMLLLPVAPIDTLDFTSFKMHVGSKWVLDATGEVLTRDEPPRSIADPRVIDHRVRKYRMLEGGFLVIAVEGDAREVLTNLLRRVDYKAVKFIAAVSPDVDLEDEENLLWGIFTRFDPALDLIFDETVFIRSRPVYRGKIGIDATWKEGYPKPLEMTEEIKRLVDRRWKEYWR